MKPASYRHRPTAHRRTELEHVVEHNAQLEALIHRKEALLARINAFIAEVTTEQTEFHRALATSHQEEATRLQRLAELEEALQAALCRLAQMRRY